MTPTSLLPKIAAQRGMGFSALVEGILAQATRDEVEVAEAPGFSEPQASDRAAVPVRGFV
jgi:D-alanine-D-alanine ligase